jgi:DNA invertase Pin-like site-specific DNA recombinase
VAERNGWKIVREFIDQGISGAKGWNQRPQFSALCRAATKREVNVIMAWSLDRLGRSLQHLVLFLNEIRAKGVDTATPGVKALFQM